MPRHETRARAAEPQHGFGDFPVMLIFDGAIYTIDSFRKSFSRAGKQERRGTLLIKADKNLSVQTLVEICEAAKSAGFENAIIAAEPDGRR